jgi:P27 family predicted phage terminase small subunit
MRGTKPSTVRRDATALARVPTSPSWLSKPAKAEWRRIMPLLIERRILTDADMGSVENYCLAIGRIREIELQFRLDAGPIDPKLFRMQNQAMQTARQLAAELGLTPVSRSRPAVRDDGKNDDDPSPLDF